MKTRGIRVSIACAALLMLGVSAAQGADPLSRYYATLNVMHTMPADAAMSVDGNGGSYASEMELDGGIGATVAFGYEWKSGLRTEIELGHRALDATESGPWVQTGSPGPGNGSQPMEHNRANMDIGTWSLMFNGLARFEAGELRPYIGAGAGIARHGYQLSALNGMGAPRRKNKNDEHQGLNAAVCPGANGYTVTANCVFADENDVVFAYQAMFGVGVPISERVEIRAGYRYFATQKPKIGRFESEYETHNLEAAVVWRF